MLGLSLKMQQQEAPETGKPKWKLGSVISKKQSGFFRQIDRPQIKTNKHTTRFFFLVPTKPKNQTRAGSNISDFFYHHRHHQRPVTEFPRSNQSRLATSPVLLRRR